MTDDRPLEILLTWKPPRGLERIQRCVEEVQVSVAEDRETVLARVADAEVIFATYFDAEMLRAAKRLRWVHAASGGVESMLFPELVTSPVQLTCGKASFDIPCAEYTMAVMLAFARRIDYDIRQRAYRTFEWREPFELKDKTVGIIGLGHIGREIARKARCFDMQAIGLARRPRTCPPYLDEVLLPDQLPYLLTASDFVVVAVPNTPETQGLIGETELRAMKQTAYLIDVSGRPVLYDLDALARALQEKWIAGASLQVQPPPDSPLWDVDNLLISFHRATSYEQYDRFIDLFCENVNRYRQGQPLLGLVDKVAGY
jgi:phosphoglycerate dehydrogenase-like enzyme